MYQAGAAAQANNARRSIGVRKRKGAVRTYYDSLAKGLEAGGEHPQKTRMPSSSTR